MHAHDIHGGRSQHNCDTSIQAKQVMKDLVHKEMIKSSDADIINQISNNKWVNIVYCVLKKKVVMVIRNEQNEFIPTRTVTG